jgi:uncharacterized protein (TIGR02611 family)
LWLSLDLIEAAVRTGRLAEAAAHVAAVRQAGVAAISPRQALKATTDARAHLVGHSYGGAVVTEAGLHDKVAALVCVAAFAPDKGESVNTLIAGFPAGGLHAYLRGTGRDPTGPDRHHGGGMLAVVNDLVRLLRRIAVTIAGTVILAVGVVLLVAPGPGLVVIALGLAVFAIEYEWARRHLAAVQARARSAALKAAASRVATASAVLFGVGAIGLGVVLVFTDLLPLSGVGTGVGVAAGGVTVLVTMAYSVRESRRAEKAGEDENAGCLPAFTMSP